MGRVHVVGAGVAGLAAALSLSRDGVHVSVHEAAGHAGGRCRSFHDDTLDREIDNGNHLLLSGNTAVAAYRAETGANETFVTLSDAEFPFIDLSTGERWTIRPNAGRVPWWICDKGRRVPNTRAWDYLSALRLMRAGPDATVSQVLGGNANLFHRFWEPLAVSVLNTPAPDACARLLWPVLVETFGLGAAACRPMMARQGLSKSLVAPAQTTLEGRGAEIRFGKRLQELRHADNTVTQLDFGDHEIALGQEDSIVLALPARVAHSLIREIRAPNLFHPIVNVHFRLDRPPTSAPIPFLGMVGGTAEWAFVRGDILSVTVSAADALAGHTAEDIVQLTWPDVVQAFELPDSAAPPSRVIKERRATFAQTPESERQRPGTETHFRNLFLAGDWTNTRLPATIEGAIRSGFAAAEAVKKAANAQDFGS